MQVTELLKDKRVIFFDVGYTLDRPASGDWMFTNRFLGEAGARLRLRGADEIARARDAGLSFLAQNHLVVTTEDECGQFYRYYSILSDALDLGLSEEQRRLIAVDRACNMENYILYPGAKETLETLARTHKLGVISDTWPSIRRQLAHLGIAEYFSFETYSCEVGVFKPDRRMYLDALRKCGVPAEETVFLDDSVRNLEGAAALGITPILAALHPAADVETPWPKIHDLRELL